MAGAVNLPLTLERDVAERAVEGGQGQVAERVHENLVDLVRILAQAGEVLAPLLAQRLRQYMLDRQAGSLKVDELRTRHCRPDPASKSCRGPGRDKIPGHRLLGTEGPTTPPRGSPRSAATGRSS